MIDPTEASATRKVVLFVDDDPHLRRMTQTALTHGGFKVLLAGHGQQALHVVMSEAVDIVVMDIDMPEMDGIETLRALKANAVTAPIPVIMVTAADRANDVLRSIKAGADLHIIKPFDPNHLIDLLRRHLSYPP
jgi:DNA-binding response OmpR family regulator